jgi:hypothetical protein
MQKASQNRYLFIILMTLFMVLVPASALADPTVGSSNSLQTGKVTSLGKTDCPVGAAAGATCIAIDVSCSGIPDLTATVATANPSGTAKGTIILMSGNTGTTLFNSGFASPYLKGGFRVVQLAWASDWEDTGGVGLKSAACRPATFFLWVFNGAHKGSRTAGFCAQGNSGGGIEVAYSLAEYGLADYFDYLVLSSGPGFARIDYGCDPPLYTGGPLNLCPLLQNAPYAFTKGMQVDKYEGTNSCATSNPPQSDINKWAADSIISDGATYSYPKTDMSWYFCTTPPVINSTGEGEFYISQVTPKSPADVNCYSGFCQGEGVWQDPNAFSMTQSEMLSKCVPNH